MFGCLFDHDWRYVDLGRGHDGKLRIAQTLAGDPIYKCQRCGQALWPTDSRYAKAHRTPVTC